MAWVGGWVSHSAALGGIEGWPSASVGVYSLYVNTPWRLESSELGSARMVCADSEAARACVRVACAAPAVTMMAVSSLEPGDVALFWVLSGT